MKKIFLFLITAATITACSSSKNGFELSGNLINANDGKVVLKEMRINNLETVDTIQLDDSGNFYYSSELEIPNFFLLEKDPANYITLIIHPGEKISIEAEANNMMEDYSIKGSADSKLLKEYTGRLMSAIKKIKGLNQTYRDSLQSPNISSIMEDLDKKSKVIGDEIRVYTISFIEENTESLASLMALYQQLAPQQYILDPMTDIEYYKLVDSTLYSLYPQSEPVMTLHKHVSDLKERKKIADYRNSYIGIGSTPPDITLPNPDGDTLRLSSLKGQIVLLDFWAAWCSPCRMENPNIVSNYKKFHNKGFEIFQVSLDRTKENWTAGIKDDQLGDWLHVSDLKYWQSSVVSLYNIEGIPASFLLDRDGKVIAKNLRGKALEEKLTEVFQE